MFLFPYIPSALKTKTWTWNVSSDYIYPNVCEAFFFSWFFQTGFLCVIALAVLDPLCGRGWLASNSHRSTCPCLPSMRAPPSGLCEAFFCGWMYMDSVYWIHDWALQLEVFSLHLNAKECIPLGPLFLFLPLSPTSYLPRFMLNTSPWGISSLKGLSCPWFLRVSPSHPLLSPEIRRQSPTKSWSLDALVGFGGKN